MTLPTIDRSSYPTANEVIARMKAMNFWPKDSDTTAVALAERQAVIAAESAAEEWEHGVDWRPFLVGYGAETNARKFDNADQQGYLDLGAAAQSLTSVTLDGTALTAGTDYWTRHFTEPVQGRPITGLLFRRGLNVYCPRLPELIVVTSSSWGYCTEVPADVYNDVLDAAALCVLLGVNNPRDISNISHDGFSLGFDPVGPVDPKTVLNNLGKNFYKQITKHRRPY